MRIHTASELREIDRHAAETLGLPTLVLMENAGRAVAETAQKEALWRGGRVFVVCGKGNKGGDGWVAARHLAVGGMSSVVVSMAAIEDLKGDALANAKAAVACGVVVSRSLSEAGSRDVVIDAIFGTGLTRAPEGRALELIQDINAAHARGSYVIAVDVPSGIDADRPEISGDSVIADVTIALHALKPALVQWPSRERCGEIVVAPIGIPPSTTTPTRTWVTQDLAKRLLPKRATDAHKGTNGHVLVVAGSPGKSGAGMLASRGALRSGAGLVTLATSPEVLDRVLPGMPEIMGFPLPALTADALLAALDRKTVLVIGPGLARTEHTGAMLVELLRHVMIAAVLDADALNALAADPHALKHLDRAQLPPLLTPHPMELARLLGVSVPDIQKDRFAAATEAAKRFRAYVVLKGAGTVIAAPDGSLWVNSTGTPALATGGTGDVLAGIAGGLVSQQIAMRDAAVLAPFVHGRAGELASHGHPRGLAAGDVAERTPDALAELA